MSRRRLLVGIVVAALALTGAAYTGAGLLDSPEKSPPDYRAPEEGRLIQPVENGSHLWPYTSQSRSVEQRALAVNLVIQGHPNKVYRSLTDRSNLDFQELPEEEGEAESDAYQITINESSIDWEDAHGSTRYTYISGEGGGWMDESYQLFEGEYLGQRIHIRAYEDPQAEYTGIQVHREYFDFFRLRHQVTDIDESAVRLEQEFIDQPFVEEVRREYHGLRGGWSDGWVSTVRLGTLGPVTGLLGIIMLGAVASRSTQGAVRSLVKNFTDWAKENWTGFALVATLVVLVTGTRILGVALEQAFSDISTQLFAGAVYPILAIGPPIAVLVLARRLEPIPGFAFAVLGFGMAVTLDAIWVGLSVVPVRLVLHRFGLMLALGIIALGVARAVRDDTNTIDHERGVLVAGGVLAWFSGLLMPLLGVI